MTRLIFALAILLALTAMACDGLDDAKKCSEGTGDLDLDIEHCTREIDSGDLSNEKLAHTFYYRGNAYANKGDYDRAIADYDQAIELKPVVQALHNRGRAYYLKGDYDRAIADYDQTIRLKPDYAVAFNDRGLAYYRKGEYDRAIADYDQAIRLDPDYALAFNNRGSAYDDKGDYDRAIADYTQAIRLDTLEGPRKAWPFNNRGNTYKAKGQYDRAIADYDQAIRLQPDYALAFNNRGEAYAGKGEHDRAIADYNAAIRLDPDDAGAYNNFAWLLATTPDTELRDGRKAVTLATKAVHLNDTAPNRDTLAAAYAEARRFNDAVAEQERAIEMLRAAGASAKEIADLQSRLGLYLRHQPYRE